MSREDYLWCLVDRYLSMDNFSYREALECARRDVYDIPNDREDLDVLARHCALHVDMDRNKRQSSQKEDHFIFI